MVGHAHRRSRSGRSSGSGSFFQDIGFAFVIAIGVVVAAFGVAYWLAWYSNL